MSVAYSQLPETPAGSRAWPVCFELQIPRSRMIVSKTRTAKVVSKSTCCSFYLKVPQRRAHDVSQGLHRPIVFTGRRRERFGGVRISENLPTSWHCWTEIPPRMSTKNINIRQLEYRCRVDLVLKWSSDETVKHTRNTGIILQVCKLSSVTNK